MGSVDITKYELMDGVDASMEGRDEEGNSNFTVIYDEDGDNPQFRIFVESFVNEGSKTHKLLDAILEAEGKNASAELRIHSNGGDVQEGLRLIDVMDTVFQDRITAYLNSIARSMGAVFFCYAPKRVIFPNSEIMFHNYSTMLGGKGSELTERVDHTNDVISKVYDKYIVEKGFLSQEEIARLYDGKDYWFTADEICRRNIATHVSIKGIEIPALEYITMKDKGMGLDEIHSEIKAR